MTYAEELLQQLSDSKDLHEIILFKLHDMSEENKKLKKKLLVYKDFSRKYAMLINEELPEV
ncbi:MAG: hypothetical protein K0U41_06690 [Gammaproteobacteria bacterium]|nr:hypothetical protein [Gammaproteobacteria bacterium]